MGSGSLSGHFPPKGRMKPPFARQIRDKSTNRKQISAHSTGIYAIKVLLYGKSGGIPRGLLGSTLGYWSLACPCLRSERKRNQLFYPSKQWLLPVPFVSLGK